MEAILKPPFSVSAGMQFINIIKVLKLEERGNSPTAGFSGHLYKVSSLGACTPSGVSIICPGFFVAS